MLSLRDLLLIAICGKSVASPDSFHNSNTTLICAGKSLACQNKDLCMGTYIKELRVCMKEYFYLCFALKAGNF